MNRSQWVTVLVVMAIAIAVVVFVVVQGGSRSAGYNVILMNPNNPAQALGQWVTPTKPKVVVGGVEWTDAIGRYRMVSGTVYVEQILLATTRAAPTPAPQPVEDPDASEPEVTDGE